MKKFIKSLGIVALGIFLFAGVANAVSPCSVPFGCTGVGTLTGIIKGNGTSAFSAIVSGTDIKTINGSSVLGSGDLIINTMVYPGAGIPLSTGSAWGTSITDNSANWNTAYGWGNWASNFGTTIGTIAQGNDSRINNGQTAYGWGNHASAGYLTSASSLDPSKVTQSATYRFVSDTEKSTWNGKQDALNGTGLVRATGTSISYDNSTYLTSVGTGVANELTYWSGTNSLGSLATATYPSLTEVSYLKGVTSAIQTQLNGKLSSLSGALLATGATTGATSQAQAFTNGVITGKVYPGSDSTTALQFNKADGTTNVLNIDTTNGRVGIGTTSPGSLLTVANGDIQLDNSYYVKGKNTLGTVLYNLLGVDGSNYLSMNGPLGMRLFVGGVEKARLQPSGGLSLGNSYLATDPGAGSMIVNGNVGIGTAAPSAALHVFGNNGTDGISAFFGIDAAHNGIAIGNNATIGYIEGMSTPTGTRQNMALNPNGGNVGIGTTGPNSKLDVQGGDLLTGNGWGWVMTKTDGSRARAFYIDASNNTLLRGVFGDLGLSSAAGNVILSPGGAEAMRLTSTGNVGMATTSPTNILSFGGNAARTIWMERHTTSNTAGNNLTIQSGGATPTATDKNGGMFTLAPGLSTGTGFSSIRLQGLSRAASTGTTDNTLEDRVIIPAVKNLTNTGAIGLFDVALPTLATAGGMVDYTITATDGTDMHSISGRVIYDVVNKGGVYTSQMNPTVNTVATSNIGGTNVPVFTIITGTNKFTVTVTDTDSLTTTVLQIRYTIHNNSGSAITQL
jgi:hypothetical protein